MPKYDITKQEIKGGESDRIQGGKEKVKRKGGGGGSKGGNQGGSAVYKTAELANRPEGKLASFHIQNYLRLFHSLLLFLFLLFAFI